MRHVSFALITVLLAMLCISSSSLLLNGMRTRRVNRPEISTSVQDRLVVKWLGQIVASALIVVGSLGVVPERAYSDEECTSSTNVISGATIDSCRRVGLVKGRLRSCGASENCFSTAATAAGKYIAPWTYKGIAKNDLTAEEAWVVLKLAVQETGLKVLQDKELGLSGDRYLLAAEKGDSREKQPAGSSLFYELVLRADDRLILQRAFVDKTVFLYPLQQPVSDFGALKSRLDGIIEKAGFLKSETE